MNAQPATLDNRSNYFSSSGQSTDIVDRNLESAGNFLKARQGAANKGHIATSSEPLKVPSTFSRSVSDKQLSPAELLAEWNGCVTSVQKEGVYFSATLSGVEGKGVKGEEEDAIIPISDVSEGDKDLLHPGNFFRLCVMYEVSSSGQPRRYTQVVFRRLPAYRQQDLDAAVERGRKLARGLRVE